MNAVGPAARMPCTERMRTRLPVATLRPLAGLILRCNRTDHNDQRERTNNDPTHNLLDLHLTEAKQGQCDGYKPARTFIKRMNLYVSGYRSKC